MPDLLLRGFIGLVTRILTERFIARGLIRAARYLAESTTNKLDDGMVDDMADALGQTDLVIKG